MAKTIYAAGTVMWRRVPVDSGGTRLMVLLIHRTKQRDVSFPKGKVDPGESLPQTAVRETLEETGMRVALGPSLGLINYDLPGSAKKVVQYWAAKVTQKTALASIFKPNREVQALEWVLAEEVPARLSYAADRELFAVFMRLAEYDLLDSFQVTLLRHAKAEPRSEAYPEDHLRPLSAAGVAQAQTLAAILSCFKPRKLYTSTAKRCRHTVKPVAELLGRKARQCESLSQDHWDAGDLHDTRRLIGKVVSREKSALLCSHRPVLPDLALELRLATGSLPGSYMEAIAQLPPAGFAVFHFAKRHPGAGILSVETYPLKHKS